MTRVVRGAAIAIVLVALVDPVVAIGGAARARIAVAVDDSQSAGALRIRERLTRDLARDYDIVRDITSEADAAVVIGERYPDFVASGFTSTFSGTISTITIPPANVSITHVAAPREVPAATMVRIEAAVDARNAVDQSTDLVARIDGAEVGRASHRWTRADERWMATLDIAPFGEPPFVVRIEAGTSSADVAVSRRTRPIRVQAYDTRPSWASTFTRRALESDPRFQVESIASSSRGVAARTPGAVALSDDRLDEFDALLVGGADGLSAADAHALDRYMRARGGAVILVPDQRVLSPGARDLMSAVGVVLSPSERLIDRPATLTAAHTAATLQASEMLVFGPSGPGIDVLASLPGSAQTPVVVSIPRGAGRLLLSGAMDAWRFRAAADRGFVRFWTATVAGLALATPPLVDVSVTPSVLRPMEPAEVVVRAPSSSGAARVSATVDGRSIRLWPDAEQGTFRGTLIAANDERRSVVRVVVSDTVVRTSSHVVPIRAGVRHAADAGEAPLGLLAASHRGIDVDADHVADVVRFVRGAVTPPRTARRAHPMRSPWWLVAFVGSLGGEWWLRRRRGLR